MIETEQVEERTGRDSKNTRASRSNTVIVTEYKKKPDSQPLSGPNVAAVWNAVLTVCQDRDNQHVQKALLRVCRYTTEDPPSALTQMFDKWTTNPPRLRILEFEEESEGDRFAFTDRDDDKFKGTIFLVKSVFDKYEEIAANGLSSQSPDH